MDIDMPHVKLIINMHPVIIIVKTDIFNDLK